MLLEARDYASGVIGRVRKNLASLSGPQKMLAAGLGAAALGGIAAAYELGKFAHASVKAAAVFQQNNTLLTTQAGVAQSRIKGLGDQFLMLAPQLGQTAASLSQAFYHIASGSVPVRDQLGALRAAGEGAAIGNANLEDTTNSLVAVLRSGITGFRGVSDAMATVMAIVGTGNMRLQDFNQAMGTGFPGAAKTFGMSLTSAGAALAYLTDTGMHANMAATRLTMAIALMAAPSQHASKLLHAVGMSSNEIKTRFPVVTEMLKKAGLSFSQLAVDLKKPDGFVVALQDLKHHMEQAGMSASLQSALIARAFGGGHMGKAIMQIFEELPRVAQKFDIINASVSSFGKHWQQTTATAVFQAKSLHAGMNAISVGIGEALLPAVQQLAKWLIPIIARLGDWTTHHKKLAAIILGSMFVFSLLTAVIGMLGLAIIAFEAVVWPVILVVLVLAADVALLIAVFIYWRQILKFLRSDMGTLALALFALAAPAIAIPALIALHWGQIVKTARHIFADLTSYLATQWNRITAYAEMTWRDFKGWLTTLWGDILNDAVSAWNNFTSFLGGIWAQVKNGVIDAWNDVIAWFAGVAGRIIEAIGPLDFLYDTGRAILEGLWDGMQYVWRKLPEWLRGVIETLAAVVALGPAGLLLTPLGRKILEGLWDGMQAVWRLIPGWLKGVIETIAAVIALGSAGLLLTPQGRAILEGLWDGMKAIWSKIPGWLLGVIATIVSVLALGPLGLLLTPQGRAIIEGLWDGAKTIWKKVESWLGDFKGMILQFFKGSDLWLFLPGAGIIQGIWDGMKSVWNSVTSWLGGLGGTIKGLKGPLDKDLVLLQPEGAAIMQGLQVGMRSQFGALASTLSQATSGIVSSARSGAASSIRGGALTGAGGGTSIVFDFRGSQVMSDHAIQQLTDKIGGMLARQGLPMSGMQVRRG